MSLVTEILLQILTFKYYWFVEKCGHNKICFCLLRRREGGDRRRETEKARHGGTEMLLIIKR